jgi:hypothetical protein
MAATVADITKSLSGIDFPASKQDLVKHAQQKKASKEVIKVFEQMPEKEYTTMREVEHEFGELK